MVKLTSVYKLSLPVRITALLHSNRDKTASKANAVCFLDGSVWKNPGTGGLRSLSISEVVVKDSCKNDTIRTVSIDRHVFESLIALSVQDILVESI